MGGCRRASSTCFRSCTTLSKASADELEEAQAACRVSMLYDGGVIRAWLFLQLDQNGTTIIAHGPRGPDRPGLERCRTEHGAGNYSRNLAGRIQGHADVARLVESTDASTTINTLVDGSAGEINGRKVLLSVEAHAAD